MKKFLQFFDEKNILSLPQLFVLTVGNKEDCHLEIKISYTKDKVLFLKKIFCPFTPLTSPFKCTNKVNGSLKLGLLWTIKRMCL